MDDPHRIGREHGQFVIRQVDDLVGVARQRRGVAGHEVLAVANAQHDRTAQAGDDQHLGPIAEEDRQAVGSLELQQGLLHRGDQRPIVRPPPCLATGGCRFKQLATRWAITSVSVAEWNS